MKLNKEELLIGFIFGLCFWPIIKLLAILLALTCSFLWSLSGMNSIPSIQPVDEGSWLGRFWYKITSKYASVLTRTTIYSLLLITYLVTLAI